MTIASQPLAAGTRLHVERTDDPAVLRWVVHHSGVAEAGDGACRPGAASALGALTVTGDVVEVCVLDGHVLVRAASPERWSSLAPQVHRAVATDLAAGADWLVRRDAGRPGWSLRLADASSADAAHSGALGGCPSAGAACGHCSHR
ncbi:MAG: hypothetical protein U0Q03_14640 [Acidimicrobiales bacterium]